MVIQITAKQIIEMRNACETTEKQQKCSLPLIYLKWQNGSMRKTANQKKYREKYKMKLRTHYKQKKKNENAGENQKSSNEYKRDNKSLNYGRSIKK